LDGGECHLAWILGLVLVDFIDVVAVNKTTMLRY
jgi:hypothetical protein